MPEFVRGVTPYWKYDCGCEASALEIRHCPTHGAAGKLLAVVDMLLAIDGEEPTLPENVSQIRGTLVHARSVRREITEATHG